MHSKTSIVAGLLASTFCFSLVTDAAPSDPMTSALPSRDTSAPEQRDAPRDPKIEAQTGAVTYQVPIVLPKGRRDMAPSLALTYSSSSALRGGLAVGWQLDGIPVIVRDPEVLETTAYRVDGGPRLVQVLGDGPELNYRAEYDSSFTRYRYTPATTEWRVATLDGRVRTYGRLVSGRWYPTRETDPFGNTVEYTYLAVSALAQTNPVQEYRDIVPSAITYTSNAAQGLVAHAKVDFEYAPEVACGGVPVGAAISNRFGYSLMSGSRQLAKIRTSVRETQGSSWRTSREYALGYDQIEATCARSGLRYLTTVTETAFSVGGVTTVLPPQTFRYGDKERALDHVIDLPSFGGGERGSNQGPTSMLLDFNGDGWVDRLTMGATASVCQLAVHRGTGIGRFEATPTLIDMPSAYPATPHGTSSREGCTLQGQRVADGFCDRAIVSYEFADWNGDGRVDILSSLRGDPIRAGGDFGNPLARAIQATAGEYCHHELQRAGLCDMLRPPDHTVCPHLAGQQQDGSTFRMYVQRNLDGTTVEPWSTALRVASPTSMHGIPSSPLEVEAEVLRPDVPSFIDINGDGLLDAVALKNPPNAITYQHGFPADQPHFEPPRSLGPWPILYVWPGTGAGAFGAMQEWSMPIYSQNMLAIGYDATRGVISLPSTVVFRDFDADGLPDIIANILPGNELAVLYNTGRWFAAPKRIGVALAVDEAREEISPSHVAIPSMITSGVRGRVKQIFDVDADGYPELVVMPTGTNIDAPATARWAYRFGGAWTGYRTLAPAWEPLEGTVILDNHAWYRRSEAIDVTGDGRDDMVTWQSRAGGQAVVTTDRPGAAPLRTLTSIDNGRGGVTSFEYGLSTNPDLVGLEGRQLPAGKLIHRVTKTAPGAQALTTTYRYARPRHGHSSSRARGATHFQGFESVTVDSSGSLGTDAARTISTFRYEPIGYDWRGVEATRLVLVKQPDGSHAPVTHTEIEYQNLIIQSGVGTPPTATVPLRVTVRRCAAADTAASCATSLQSMSSVTETWRPYYAGGYAVHHQHASTRRSGSDVGATLISSRLYAVASLGGVLRQVVTESTEADEAALPALLSRNLTMYDSQLLPHTTVAYADASRTSVTYHGFDSVGNLTWTIKPAEVEAWTMRQSSIQYDTHRLYPRVLTNELGHVVTTAHEVATGATWWSSGPNPADYKVFMNDGLGRPLANYRVTEPDAMFREVESFEYDDANSRLTRRRIADHETGTVVVSTTQSDGLGRVIRQVENPGGEAAETTYEHDAGGHLERINSPDPSGSVKPVAYQWTHDGLGRPLSFTRPDGGGELITYRGSEMIVTDRYHASSKTFRTDARGQLRSVHEHPQPRATSYEYDALGQMRRIADADDVVTTMQYDMQGNRTAVTRGSRTWINGYDAGARLVSRRSPAPTAAAAADYTTIYRYDGLDRLKAIYPAVRDSSPEDRARLGIGTTELVYDAQRIGSLAMVVLPFGRIDFEVDVDGKVRSETRTIEVPDTLVPLVQRVERRYNALGDPQLVRWDDGTEWQTAYDASAKVSSVAWRNAGSGLQPLATYARNAAGVPIRRTGLDQVREWQHDQLGRTLYDRVSAADGRTFSERSYGYAGDDLVEVFGTIAGVSADASYSYDVHHRLESAIGPGDYRADLAYSSSGNITSARVTGTTASRDVTYRYSTVDPQAVEELTDSGGTFAKLAYDGAGNVVTRALRNGDLMRLTWDGENQLRETSGGGGTESYMFGLGAERMVAFGKGYIKTWFGESETHYTRAGVQTRRYHHISAGEPIARIENSRDVELQYADARSNLMLSIGAGDSVTWFLYGAFGEVLEHDDRSEHRRRFNGKEDDVVSGLRHYGFRSYDPVTMRWASADPLFRFAPDAAWAEPQRANLYAFSLNNPISYYDPDGRNPLIYIRLAWKAWDTIGEAHDVGSAAKAFQEGYAEGGVDTEWWENAIAVVDGKGAITDLSAEAVGDMLRRQHAKDRLAECMRPSVDCSTKEGREKAAKRSAELLRQRKAVIQHMRQQLRYRRAQRLKALGQALAEVKEAAEDWQHKQKHAKDEEERKKAAEELDRLQDQAREIQGQIDQVESQN